MDQAKRDILKKKIAEVAPTPGAIVGGAVSSAYNGVKNAVSGAASTISNKIKERFGPVSYDRATYKPENRMSSTSVVAKKAKEIKMPNFKLEKLIKTAAPEWKSTNSAYNKAYKNNTLGLGFGEPNK